MNASLEFDEKDFWLELFSIVVRRETTREDQSLGRSIGTGRANEQEQGSDHTE
jgi:hypothetical protein